MTGPTKRKRVGLRVGPNVFRDVSVGHPLGDYAEASRSAHTVSQYLRHPPAGVTLPDHPPALHPFKKRRKRTDAEQLRVLNEVYARAAFPSAEERQELEE